MSNLWMSVFFNTGIVILVIMSIFFVMKRLRGGQAPQNASLQMIGYLNLSMKEKVCVISVGEKQIVIGVTQSSITPLLVLQDENEKLAISSKPGTFKESLLHVLQGKSQ